MIPDDMPETDITAVLDNVRRHYSHACRKHPHFSDVEFPDGYGQKRFSDMAAEAKGHISESMKRKACNPFLVTTAEMLEVAAELAAGNYERAEAETYDAIAVLVRLARHCREKQGKMDWEE